MIRGFFLQGWSARRPYVQLDLEFPAYPHLRGTNIGFLVDTGADRTILSTDDAERIGLDVSSLETGIRSVGIGGSATMRVLE